MSKNDKAPNPIAPVLAAVAFGALGGLAGALVSIVPYFIWAVVTEASASLDQNFGVGAFIIVSACILIGLLFGAVPPISGYMNDVSAYRRRQAGEAKRRADAVLAAEADARARQLEYERMLESLSKMSAQHFISLPKALSMAEEDLKLAAEMFPVPSYGRFWDAMFAARDRLNKFQSSVEAIRRNAAQYAEYSKLYKGPVAPFPVSLDDVAEAVAGNGLYEVFATLYNKADTDKGYSDKLDNREMKLTMKAGFESLENSVNRMGSEISGAINSLSSSIEGMGSSINSLSSSIDYSNGVEENANNALLNAVLSQQAEVAGARRELKEINRRARYGY